MSVSIMTAAGCVLPEPKKDFDLKVVLNELTLALNHTTTGTGEILTETTEDDGTNIRSSSTNLIGCTIIIKHYLTAFKELARFFSLIGPVFGFVARDLLHKMAVVQKHASSHTVGHHYSTLSDMVQFELDSHTVYNKGSNASGTRTFLRLHWALEFIIEFMDKLSSTVHETRTSKVVLEVYNRTLALHHPWLTRKLAMLAVLTLPSIKTLIDIMCKHDYDEVTILLKEIVNIGRNVLEQSNTLFEHYDLTNIP